MGMNTLTKIQHPRLAPSALQRVRSCSLVPRRCRALNLGGHPIRARAADCSGRKAKPRSLQLR